MEKLSPVYYIKTQLLFLKARFLLYQASLEIVYVLKMLSKENSKNHLENVRKCFFTKSSKRARLQKDWLTKYKTQQIFLTIANYQT